MSKAHPQPTPATLAPELVVSSSILICTPDAKIVANCFPGMGSGLGFSLSEAGPYAEALTLRYNAHTQLVQALQNTVKACEFAAQFMPNGDPFLNKINVTLEASRTLLSQTR